jgi:hypothetical protein
MISEQQSDHVPVIGAADTVNKAARLYLALLKRCVSNFSYDVDLDLMRAKRKPRLPGRI